MARRKTITFETATGDDRWRIDNLTVDQIRSLPPSTELVYAGRALGYNRDRAYREARLLGYLTWGDERLPVTKVCGNWRVKRADLMRILDISEAPMAAPTAGTAA